MVSFDDDGTALGTEVVNFAEETEVLDLAGETRKLDDFDTQILEEGYESEGTLVLENSDDEVCVHDTPCRDSGSDNKKLNMGGGDDGLGFDAAGDDDEEASSGIELDAKDTENGNANEAPDMKA
ncbi:hypothetical protein RYX36_012788 [Vicia faba]